MPGEDKAPSIISVRRIARVQRAVRRAFVSLCCCLLLTACATAVPPRPSDAAKTRMISGVPFHPQEDFQCGPSSLATLLNFHGDPVTPEEIEHDIFRSDIRGTVTLDMGLYPRTRGFVSTFGRSSPEALVREIDSGHPAVVMVNEGFATIRKLHYMVVTGYDPEAVVVNSGRHEGMRLAWDDFLSTWEGADYWMLTISPKDKG